MLVGTIYARTRYTRSSAISRVPSDREEERTAIFLRVFSFVRIRCGTLQLTDAAVQGGEPRTEKGYDLDSERYEDERSSSGWIWTRETSSRMKRRLRFPERDAITTFAVL